MGDQSDQKRQNLQEVAKASHWSIVKWWILHPCVEIGSFFLDKMFLFTEPLTEGLDLCHLD